MKLTLPFPPTTGNHTTNHAQGRAWTRGDVKTYRDRVRMCCREQNAPETILARLTVYATFHWPDARKRDLDNLWKVAGDALTKAGVWQDDNQIWELHLKRGPVFAGGKVEVVILELECIV